MPSGVGVAVVCTLAASLPASGSVRANALIHSPRGQLGQPLRLLLGRAEQHQRPRADRVMRVDEQRRAAAVAAEHFDHPAIGDLAEPAAAEFAGQAGAQHAELAQPVDHALRDLGVAVDRHRVDVLAAELPQLGDLLGGARVAVQIGVGQQLVTEVLAKEQALGKADLVHAIAEHFFGLRHLLFVIQALIHFHSQVTPADMPPEKSSSD